MSLIHTKVAKLRRQLTILLAVAACAAPVSATQAQATTRARTRCTSCASSRDAARDRREQLLLKIDSLRYEFEHERLSVAKRQRLSEEMSLAVRALEASLGEMGYADAVEVQAGEAMARASARAAPTIAVAIRQGRYVTRGYLGVVFDGPSVKLPGRELMIRFLDYPRISMVEPSSPAERAGLQEGDTLLAFNGNDVRDRAISLTKLLVPEQRITVRIRRDGNGRDFRVKIDTSPDYMVNRATMAPMAVMPPMAPMAPGQVRVQSGDDLLPGRPPVGAEPPILPRARTSVWVVSDGMGGAKLESITEGLGKALGVASGVLVLKVGPGTPAYKSGLRDGDVILRAAGQSVRTVRELRAVAEGDREEGVKLVIQRDKRQRELTLRW